MRVKEVGLIDDVFAQGLIHYQISNTIEEEIVSDRINTVIEFKEVEKVKVLLSKMVKRSIDILGSIVGIVALLPLTLIVAIVNIACKEKGKIFYTQKRIGKNGKMFKLYKFRTMVDNADEVLEELLKDPKYKKEWNEKQKLSDDPRITKIGNILRKTSLDELPQFINVLNGEMSLIGPRPLVEGELDVHNGNHEIYESVRPGISGWWAANGRSCTDYEERLKLEYYYCRHYSIKLDIKCIFRTIKAVLCRTGAK